MPSSMNWVDGPTGGTPLSAANLNKLMQTADVGTAGTPTGDALRAALGQPLAPTGGDDTAHLTARLPGALHLPVGSWKSSGITLSGQSRVSGEGSTDGFYRTALSEIRHTDRAADSFTVDAAGCLFQDFALIYDQAAIGGTPLYARGFYMDCAPGGQADVTTPAGGTKIRGVSVKGFWDCFYFFNDQMWEMAGVLCIDPVTYGVRIDHSTNPDNGDMSISNSQFLAGPSNASPDAAIYWEGGGGLKFVNNKINSVNGHPDWQWKRGFDLNAQNGTGLTLIGNSSVENWSETGVRIRAKQGDPHSNVIIHGTEIAGYLASCLYGIYVGASDTPSAASPVIYRCAISNNVIWVPSTATNAIYVDACRDLTIEGCTLDNSGSANAYIHLGPACTNISIGRNTYKPGAAGTVTRILELAQPMNVGGQVSGQLDWALPNITDTGVLHDVWRLEIADGTTMRLDFTASVLIAGVNNTTTLTCSRVLKRQGTSIYIENVGTDVVFGPPINVNFDLSVTGQIGVQLSVDPSDSGANGTSGNSTLSWSGGHPASISAKN